MYLTVQRVRSSRGKRGINGALYLHGSGRSDPRWAEPDLRAIVGGDLGNQVVPRVDVAPGGNAVESFLDVVCPDDISIDELRQALESFRHDLQSSRQLNTYGHFAVEFSLNLAEEGNERPAFDELRDAALDLFQQPRRKPWMDREPLIIHIEATENGWRFALDDASRQRLITHFGADLQLARVAMPFEVADDFTSTYGEIYPFVPEWVTSKPRNELLLLGGVRLVRDGETIWEWPRRAA